MIDFKRTNTLIAWTVFAISLLVYYLTLERTVSFWDCGEFISAAYKLQITHPPGAPLYQLLGRLLSLFSFGNTEIAAFFINMLSALSSAFCVLLTYLITVRIAVKIINPLEVNLPTKQYISIWGAGIIGAFTLAFSDTFWFSAVEAEVYSLSSLFTMLTVWAALKWEEYKSSVYHIRWLLFIAFITGLSIGVHLLNLLVIPAVVCFIYLSAKGYSFFRLLKAGIIGLSIFLALQYLIIPGIPFLAFIVDRWGNTVLNWNIGTGAIALLAAILVLVIGLLIVSRRLNYKKFHVAFLCLAFVLIGYSSYTIIPIRAVAQPPLNINKANNPASFLAYINRDQYGSRALFRGPAFNAPITAFKKDKAIWRPSAKGDYSISGYRSSYSYNQDYTMWFPRMGDVFDASSIDGYEGWTGVDKKAPPSQLKNWEFFFKYQFLHMYVRYHLWNFTGKQNDNQGHGNAMNGNSESGIGFIDKLIAAPNKNLPKSLENKGTNHYYFLPFLLGLIGLFFHAKKQKESFYALLVLFLFTGVFLSFYLNVPPFEPRERDYVFVGSFQVFSIWVGLGVFYISRSLRKWLPNGIWIGLLIGFICSPFLLISQNWDDHNRAGRSFAKDYAYNMLSSVEPNAVLMVYGDNDTYPLWYLQNVEGFRTDVRVINANLLGSEWGAFSITNKEYQSEPLELSISPYAYQQGKRNAITVYKGRAKPIKAALEHVANDSNAIVLSSGRLRSVLPTNKLILPTNSSDTVLINASHIYRSDLALLDIIANNPSRPIYFSSRSAKKSVPYLFPYLKPKGLVYKLGTGENKKHLNTSNAIATWRLEGYNNSKIYIDPEAKKVAKHYTNIIASTITLLLDSGKVKKAGNLALLAAEKFPVATTTFSSYKTPNTILMGLFKAKLTSEANKYYSEFINRLFAENKYYRGLLGTIANYNANKELQNSAKALVDLKDTLQQLKQNEKAMEIEKFLSFFAVKKP